MDWEEFVFKYKLSAYFKIDDQLEFINLFNSYMNSGSARVNVRTALSKVSETYAKVYGPNHVVVEVCKRMLAALRVGDSYIQLMREYFHPNIAIGYELSQRISTNKEHVSSIADLVAIEREINRDTKKELVLPMTIAMLGLGAISIVGKFVLPIFEKNLSESASTTFEVAFVSGFSNFLFLFWPLLIIAAGALAYGYKWSQDNWISPKRAFFDKIWPYSMYRIFWSIRIMRLLGLLKKANMRDINALKLIHQFGSPYIKNHLDVMIKSSSVGINKKDYFGKGLLDKSQQARLETYLNLSDKDFAEGLIQVSSQSVTDIKVAYKRVINRWALTLFFIGFGLVGISIGATLDGIMLLNSAV